MKKYIFAALMLSLAACGTGENKKAEEKKDLLSTDLVTNPVSAAGTDSVALNDMATMDFKDTIHDFKQIREGDIVSYDFEFVNNGKSPLVISNASGSCGCTVPEYPQEPVAPGKGGKLTVKFNSAEKTGHQEKTITINTNSKRGTYILRIKADVTPNGQQSNKFPNQ